VVKTLRGIETDNEHWRKVEKAVLDWEMETTERLAVKPYFEPGGNKGSSWTAWCTSRAPALEVARIKALKANQMLLTAWDCLPHGGILILQRWRQEVESVVAPSLQVGLFRERKQPASMIRVR